MLSLARSTEAMLGTVEGPTWRIESTAFAMGDVGNDLSDSLLEALLDSVFVADM